MFLKEIPKWCITFKTNVFKVVFSKWLSEVFLNWRCLSKHCFDSNTKTVLLSKRCFSTQYHNGITIKTSVFKVIFSKWFFKLLLNWRCLSKHCFWVYYQNGITVKAGFFKEIPKWYYFLSYCFQCNNLKIVFLGIFKLTSVCQNSVSDSNTKTVLPSEAVLFQRNTQMVLHSNLMFSKSYFKNCFPT